MVPRLGINARRTGTGSPRDEVQLAARAWLRDTQRR